MVSTVEREDHGVVSTGTWLLEPGLDVGQDVGQDQETEAEVVDRRRS